MTLGCDTASFALIFFSSIQGSKNFSKFNWAADHQLPVLILISPVFLYVYREKKFKSHPFLLVRLIKICLPQTGYTLWFLDPCYFPKPLHSPFCYTKLELVILSWVILPRGPRYSDKSLNYYLMIDSSHWNQRWIHGSRGEISLGKSTKRDRWAFIHHAEVKLLHNIITSIAYIYFCKL